MVDKNNNQLAGLKYALAAYLIWGLLPIFWKSIDVVPALQILAHRIVWSLVFIIVLIIFRKQTKNIITVIKNPRNFLYFIFSSFLIASNWGVYIWATNNEHIIEASMGYFINPLVSILLGIIFLKEKIDFLQSTAIFLAGIGVSYMVIQYGNFPWIAIFLAFSFGIYGLVRKVVQVDSIVGLGFETAILTPIALIYLINAGINGDIVFVSAGLKTTVLLITAGIVTALPLIWLVCGVKHLPLKTIGFCQYLAPSLMLVIGILVYNEPFTHMYRISFSFIWSAVIVYLLSNFDFIKKLERKVNLKGFHS